MSDFKETIKKIVPQNIWQVGRQGYLGLQHLKQYPNAQFHPWRRQSIAMLAELKDKYKGERCFIIGNGPSLKNTDVSKIKDEYTFGMNRIYMAFEEWDFMTSFLVCVNTLVIEQCAQDLMAQPMPKFFSWRSREHMEMKENMAFLHTTYTGEKFSEDCRGRMWEGATVTYVCLQLAFHMGFEEAILIGVDHSFASKGEANKTITSTGEDPNHFNAEYFGKGFRWQLPDLDVSEQSYLLARHHYERAGRKIVDATIGGQLTIFPKADYDSLFKD